MSAMTVEKRLAGERTAVRMAVRILRAEGWEPVRVWDGEENVPATTETAVLDAVFSVDESRVRFKSAKYPGVHCICVVLGNSPSEVISDASMGEGWDEALEKVWEYLEGLDC